MTKKILFIEDEPEFGRIVTQYLKNAGFFVTHVTRGKEGLNKLKTSQYELVILDLGLPDEDGLKIAKKIRRRQDTPILILTARDSTEDKVKSLNDGADDYLVKPTSLKEMVARINRLLRRDLKDNFRSSIFNVNGLEFNTISRDFRANGQRVKLTKKESAVLEYLMLKQGQVLTRMEIMDHVWGEEINPFSNTLNMVISSLRKKMERLSLEKLIHSVHGLGYKFAVERGGNNERKNTG